MSRSSIEVIRQVWDDKEGVYIEVGPDRDGFGIIEVRTVDKASVEWFGQLRFILTPIMARNLATALSAAADECDVPAEKES